MKYNNFKQRVLTLALAAVFAIGSGFFAVNSYAADGTGTANATVVTPISIGASSPNLRFGSFSTTAADQTVEIATDGARTLTGVLGLGTGQNAFGAASFAVAGEVNETYAITLPDDVTVTITTDGGGEGKTMAVSSFVSNPASTGTLDGSGDQTLLVGATITTVASQVTGIYTGNFTVTVLYN